MVLTITSSPRLPSIPGGASGVTLTVSALSDGLTEGAESVMVTLVGGALYTIGGAPAASVTIDDAPPVNTRPTAVLDLVPTPAAEGSRVTLDFSRSFDPDSGDAVQSYRVTMLEAPSGSIGGRTDGQQFVPGIPVGTSLTGLTFFPDMSGSYRFQLVVRDTRGGLSAPVADSLVVSPTPTPTVASVTIDRTTVFLPGIGQSATLHVSVVDEQGSLVNVPITWSSSRPEEVAVDRTGRLVAARIGSALIVAEAGGAKSAPAFVVVAEPRAGALLVTDAQVVAIGPALGLPPGTPADIGTQYQVRLAGVSAPPVTGTVVLATETAPVAGKVVATTQDGQTLVLTLELAPLYELLLGPTSTGRLISRTSLW